MKPRISLSQVIVAAILVSPVSADDSPGLKKARDEYSSTRTAADTKFLKNFDKVLDHVALQKIPTEQKIMRLETIKSEKKRFEESGIVPWSESMWPFLLNHQQASLSSEYHLRKSYNAEIDKAITAKNDSMVQDLRAELKSVSSVKVLAKWGHQAGNGGRWTMELYSNGMIGGKDGPATWTLEKNSMMILKWPNPQGPGGFWIDTVKVAPDGTTYSGSNQKGVKITGTYISE